jgi:flagellar biosynthesis/type III secretory pathway chaperone
LWRLEASAYELASILRERQAVMAQLAEVDEAIRETERLDGEREATESGSSLGDSSEYRDEADGEGAAESEDEEVVDQLAE